MKPIDCFEKEGVSTPWQREQRSGKDYPVLQSGGRAWPPFLFYCHRPGNGISPSPGSWWHSLHRKQRLPAIQTLGRVPVHHVCEVKGDGDFHHQKHKK